MNMLFRGVRRSLSTWIVLLPALLMADDTVRVQFPNWQTNDWQVAREPKAASPGRWTQEADGIRAG